MLKYAKEEETYFHYLENYSKDQMYLAFMKTKICKKNLQP